MIVNKIFLEACPLLEGFTALLDPFELRVNHEVGSPAGLFLKFGLIDKL
jgi:hypothetical protein